MTRMHPCRQAKRLSVLTAVFFAAGALMPVSSASNVVGSGEAQAVGFMQALVKSTLVIASAGGGKTVERDGASADDDVAPVPAATEKPPVKHLEPEFPRADGKGL